MKVIETTAPIKLEYLKEYFQDKDTSYIIDYKNSALKGNKLLTYLGNLDLPCDISIDPNDPEVAELLKTYFHSTVLCNVTCLEECAIDVLLTYKGIYTEDLYKDFVRENQEIIAAWTRKLDSLILYNTHTINSDAARQEVSTFPVNEEDSMEGINWVSLLKHEDFYQFFAVIKEDNLEFYSTYFDEYFFKGKNLYYFWANENNPLYLLTQGVLTNTVTYENWTEMLEESQRWAEQQEMAPTQETEENVAPS